MSNDKYYDDVLAYITENGETGVNILANKLNVPLSTMQRWLERQSYFRKTINRKWDLPSHVDTDIKVNTMTLMVDSVENALKLIDSQMAEIQSSIQNALLPVNTLKRAVINTTAPVAGTSEQIDPRIEELDINIKKTYAVFKKYMGVVPEEYKNLLTNVDLYRITIELGSKFMNSDFNEEISSLLLEKSDTLSEDVIEILKEYQKEM